MCKFNVLTLLCVFICFRPPFRLSQPPLHSVPSAEKAKRRMLLTPALPLWARKKATRPTRVHIFMNSWPTLLKSCHFCKEFLFLVLGRPTESAGSTGINKSTTLGSFYHLPPYLKLYDVLKATHANFKVWVCLHFKLLSVPYKWQQVK